MKTDQHTTETETETETQHQTQSTRTTNILSRNVWSIGFVLVIGTIALLLRVLDLGGFLTVDEATTWVPNSYRFMRVLQTGEYAKTPFMGHPAITTMWLGCAGVVLRRILFEWGILTHETYELVLALNRLPIALVTTAGVVVAYGFARRVLPVAVAVLAIIFWATDPFIIAFSRVLHMDVLMGTFATLSLLAICYYWNVQRRIGWLIASGILAGLAVLSKLPAFTLYPIVALVGLTGFTLEQRKPDESIQPWIIARLRCVLPRLILWGIISGITIIALWPTFWTNPVRAYEALRYGVEVEGGSAHLMGNFFLGKMDPAPGIHFYPVALVMRTTPWVLVGLFLLLLAVRPISLPRKLEDTKRTQDNTGANGDSIGSPRKLEDTESKERRETEEVTEREERIVTASMIHIRTIGILAGWIIVFIAAMSIFPLKFNRYLVPIFPALNILAAYGIVWSLQKLGTLLSHRTNAKGGRLPLLIGNILLALIAIINAAWYHPYSIVYFNQLLGGAKTGAQTFLIGWGEGMEQVADWLNQQPDIASVVTVSRMSLVLNPYLRKYAQAYRADGQELPEDAGYVTVYARHTQWGQLQPPYSDFHGKAVPLLKVNLHGVDYAWVYQVPRPMRYDTQAQFGTSLHMHGYDIDAARIDQTNSITMTIQWHTTAPLPEDYNLFVHIFDINGNRMGQLDVPLLNPHQPTSQWQPGRYIRWIHPVLLPPNLPTGTYWLSLGVYRPDDFSRLPLQHAPIQTGSPDDGEGALFLAPITLP